MSLTIDQVCVSLQKTEILKNISFTIGTGEFVSLLGESGCGKTTLLKSIAGLLEVQAGDIQINDASILKEAPEKRGTVIVFQDLRLFPHMTVKKNIAFSMELRGVSKEKQKRRVRELLDAVQLPGFEKRKIREMSGGQRQRVAVARALAADPKILLLDEPFSSLDENLREEIGRLVKKLHDELGLTTIMVTHDKAEAMKLSDRIALMKNGEIVQYDTPENLFMRPVSREAAEYMGHVNYIRGTVKEGVFKSPAVSFASDRPDGEYDLLLRPTELELSLADGIPCRIAQVLFEGESCVVTVERLDMAASLELVMFYKVWHGLELGKGDSCCVRVKAENPVLFPAQVKSRAERRLL